MQKSNKILLGWLAFIFVVGHCVAIFIYAFPDNVIPNRFKTISSMYVSPVFEQTWSLFAPCPVHDDKLHVKYYFEGDSTNWIEPMQEAHEKHALLRFSHHSDLVLGESNLLYYTRNDLNWMGISLYEPFPPDSISAFKNTSSYWMMHNYLAGTADYLYEKKPDSAVVQCSFQNVKTSESGRMILPRFTWKEKK